MLVTLRPWPACLFEFHSPFGGVKISAISWPLGKSTPLGKDRDLSGDRSCHLAAVGAVLGSGGVQDTEPSVLRPTVHLETKPLRGLWK